VSPGLGVEIGNGEFSGEDKPGCLGDWLRVEVLEAVPVELDSPQLFLFDKPDRDECEFATLETLTLLLLTLSQLLLLFSDALYLPLLTDAGVVALLPPVHQDGVCRGKLDASERWFPWLAPRWLEGGENALPVRRL